jgi:hypothetical protein
VAEVYEQQDTLHSGLDTTVEVDRSPPALRVSTIRWYSGFRESGLAVADRIIAVDGRPISTEQKDRASLVGQYAEYQAWQKAGAKDGHEVELTVLRRVVPGRGFAEHEFRGTIANQRNYRNDANRPMLGPGGPVDLDRDIFSSSWSQWHDEMIRLLTGFLDEGRLVSPSSSAFGLKQLAEHAPRVKFLQEKYPGLFARAIAHDFELARATLEGRAYEIRSEELAWRVLNEKRVEAVAAAGLAARAKFVADHAAELIPAFPSIDPILGDRNKVANKLVELPEITHRAWISQGARTCLVINQGEYWYTVDAEGFGFQRALIAARRYERTVSNMIGSAYAIIGRIDAQPTQVVVNERSYFALKVEPLAVSIGGKLFVDVGLDRGPEPLFAGEEQAPSPLVAPPASAEPSRVMEVFFEALKIADQKLWRSLFATFDVWFTGDKRPNISTIGLSHEESMWSSARAAILKQVYDARVVWSDEPRTIVSGAEFAGAPKIDETTIEVEHVGRREDGSYHAISESGLRRLWTLRRMNDGPWRIATRAGL